MRFNVSVKVNGIPTTFSFPEKAQAEEILEQEIHLLEGEADDLRSQLVGLTYPPPYMGSGQGHDRPGS